MLKYLTGENKKYWFDACKLIYHQDKLKDWIEGRRISPIHIDMGIHKGCNMRCIYCYGVKQKPSRDYIPMERLLMLMEDSKRLGVKSIAIIGDGEPTMNPGLYPAVVKGRGLGLDIAVATNGLLLNEAKVKILTNSCTWLRFNISGVDKEYDVIHRTRNGFNKFKHIVKLAVKHKEKCTIGLQMVLVPEAFSSVIPLARYAREWGVDYLVIKQYSDGGSGMPMHFNMLEYAKAQENLKIAEDMSTDLTKIIVKWSAMSDSKDITMEGKWGFDRCIDLPFLFQISGNGKCYPCGYLFGDERYCYGDITKERLIDIIYSKKYWEIIEEISKIELSKLCKGQCRHCETNKFVDKLVKCYGGDLQQALSTLCGSRDNYMRVMDNPPEHINFI